jgi:hypothetical protein
MDSRIRSSYFSRGSLRKLARQYFQYGFWRIRTIQKHRRPATLRQLAPMGFVGTWLALLIGTAAWRPIGYALAAFAGLYMLGLLAGAADVARKVGLRYALVAPLAFMAMHFCYGLGSFQGLVVFGLMRWGAKPQQVVRRGLNCSLWWRVCAAVSDDAVDRWSPKTPRSAAPSGRLRGGAWAG